MCIESVRFLSLAQLGLSCRDLGLNTTFILTPQDLEKSWNQNQFTWHNRWIKINKIKTWSIEVNTCMCKPYFTCSVKLILYDSTRNFDFRVKYTLYKQYTKFNNIEILDSVLPAYLDLPSQGSRSWPPASSPLPALFPTPWSWWRDLPGAGLWCACTLLQWDQNKIL